MHGAELSRFRKHRRLFGTMRLIGKLIDIKLQQARITSHRSLKPATQPIPITAFLRNL
jgi:hypothetical protein